MFVHATLPPQWTITFDTEAPLQASHLYSCLPQLASPLQLEQNEDGISV